MLFLWWSSLEWQRIHLPSPFNINWPPGILLSKGNLCLGAVKMMLCFRKRLWLIQCSFWKRTTNYLICKIETLKEDLRECNLLFLGKSSLEWLQFGFHLLFNPTFNVNSCWKFLKNTQFPYQNYALWENILFWDMPFLERSSKFQANCGLSVRRICFDILGIHH